MASDLVIVEQANRYVLNYFLLPFSRAGLRRVAFWGHGENRLPNRLRVSEWYRRKTLNWASWWFAYTKGTAKYLEEHGVPAWKITAVQNSVDTSEIREQVKKMTAADRAILRARLGIPELAGVGIFCGMLDKVKGVPFLIDACRIIKDRVSNFHLILVGGGPDQEVVSRMIDGMNWVHWVGPKFGAEKTELMAISDVFLLPGKVGLAILDGFAASLPMLTTNVDFHAPEVEYLEESVNGLISEVGPQSYADAVCSVLCRRERLAELRAGAAASAEKYSIENMSANFRDGVRLCLGIEKGRH